MVGVTQEAVWRLSIENAIYKQQGIMRDYLKSYLSSKIISFIKTLQRETSLIIPPDLFSLVILHLLDCCHFLDNSHKDYHVNLQGFKRKK